MLLTIVIFFLVLSVLVIIHELGHFLVARHFKVGVKEFGIGFPPRLAKLFRWKDTDFFLNLIPLGGYVSMEGELEPPESLKGEVTQLSSALFYKKPAWERFWIILAGPVINIVAAMIIFMVVYSILGIPTVVPDTLYLDSVAPNSPAAAANLPAGTQILSLTAENGYSLQPINTSQFLDFTREHAGEWVVFNLSGPCAGGKCEETIGTYPVQLRTIDELKAGEGIVGIYITTAQNIHYPWYKQLPLSIYYGCRQSYYLGKDMLINLGSALKGLFKPPTQNEVTVVGPIGLIMALDQQKTFSEGFMAILQFAGLLSLNLGIINLLPIPALDGGRIVLILLERVIPRPHIAKAEIWANVVGMALLIILMLLVTTRDVWRIFLK